MGMFDDVEKMAGGLYKDMMADAKNQAQKNQMGRVNFVLEKKLKDGTISRANSYNPILLIKAFAEFKKQLKSYPPPEPSKDHITDKKVMKR